MRRDLGVVLLSAAVCLWLVAGFAQGVLPSESFEWDAPEKMDYVTGYRLQWGPQDYADVPIHQTLYTVENFPTGWNLPVSVYSLGETTNSEPTTIHVANYIAIHEESTNGVDWVSKKVEQITFERQPTSMIRVRLQLTVPNNREK